MKELWPEAVPVLTADDICKGSLYKGEKACLIGWTVKCFLGDEYLEVIQRLLTNGRAQHLALFNDTHTLEENADLWNQTMQGFGYTEIC